MKFFHRLFGLKLARIPEGKPRAGLWGLQKGWPRAFLTDRKEKPYGFRTRAQALTFYWKFLDSGPQEFFITSSTVASLPGKVGHNPRHIIEALQKLDLDARLDVYMYEGGRTTSSQWEQLCEVFREAGVAISEKAERGGGPSWGRKSLVLHLSLRQALNCFTVDALLKDRLQTVSDQLHVPFVDTLDELSTLMDPHVDATARERQQAFSALSTRAPILLLDLMEGRQAWVEDVHLPSEDAARLLAHDRPEIRQRAIRVLGQNRGEATPRQR